MTKSSHCNRCGQLNILDAKECINCGNKDDFHENTNTSYGKNKKFSIGGFSFKNKKQDSERGFLLKNKINIVDSVDKLKISSPSLEDCRKEYDFLKDQFSKKADEIACRFGISYDENFHGIDDLVEKTQNYVSDYISDSGNNNWQIPSSFLEKHRKEYNALRGRFSIKADEIVYQFGIDWDKNFHEMDDLVEKAQYYVSGYISDSVNESIKILIERGVLDVDREKFIHNYYTKYNVWHDAFNAIIDEYARIVLDGKQLEEYRQRRKLNSGNFVGGSFAVPGDGTEGLEVVVFANIATSTLSMISNGYSFVVDEIETFKKKDALLKSVNTRKTLSDALHESILNIHYALLDVLHDYSVDLKLKPISDSDFGKAESMFNNLNKGMFGGLNKKKVIYDILSCNPYYVPVYEYMLINYGDIDGTLDKLAVNFFIDVKKLKMSQVRRFVSLETEQDAKKSLEDVLYFGKYFNCSVVEFVEEIENKINKFDLESRTFLGIEYPTKSAAEDAKKRLDRNVNSFFKTIGGMVIGIIQIIFWFIVVFIIFLITHDLQQLLSLPRVG